LYGPALPSPDGLYAVVFSAMLPRSRGTLRLGTGDPTDRPRIDPKYYVDAGDVEVMVEGLRLARELGRAEAFAPWGGEEVLAGLDVTDAEGVRQHLRSHSRRSPVTRRRG
jgi:choline dehydrogenase